MTEGWKDHTLRVVDISGQAEPASVRDVNNRPGAIQSALEKSLDRDERLIEVVEDQVERTDRLIECINEHEVTIKQQSKMIGDLMIATAQLIEALSMLNTAVRHLVSTAPERETHQHL